MNRIKNWFVERWDFFVYRASYRSFRRMYERGDGAFAFLVELQLSEYREKNQLGGNIEASARQFHKALSDGIREEILDRLEKDDIVD